MCEICHVKCYCRMMYYYYAIILPIFRKLQQALLQKYILQQCKIVRNILVYIPFLQLLYSVDTVPILSWSQHSLSLNTHYTNSCSFLKLQITFCSGYFCPFYVQVKKSTEPYVKDYNYSVQLKQIKVLPTNQICEFMKISTNFMKHFRWFET